MNPLGRPQTRKHRGHIPIARQFAPYLDATGSNYMPVTVIRTTWENMRTELGLPQQHGETGIKPIRRSMATICRQRIGEASWRQGEMMPDHVQGRHR